MNEMFTLTVIILLIVTFILTASIGRIFMKAGQPAWGVFVPFYNVYLMLKICGKPGWWIAMYLIPGVNIVFLIWTFNLLSKSFGKGVGFTIGLVLLNPIFIGILGFGSSTYVGEEKKEINLSSRMQRKLLNSDDMIFAFE